MTERKLTQEEIENLFELCEFHQVHYYDVQIELVDHLASAIEAYWVTNPALTFEEAVLRICEQFGVEPFFNAAYDSLLPPISGKRVSEKSGFESIKEAKQKELSRKYDRLQWKYIGEYFKLPKFILTLSATFILFFVFKHVDNDLMVSYWIQGFYIISLAIYLIFIYPKKFRLEIVNGKSFLLYEHFRNIKRAAIGIGFASYNIIPLLSKMNRFKLDSPLSGYFNFELLTAFLITFLGIMMVAMFSYIPRRVKEDFLLEFPQFVKS
jgi:hypothetical protein